MNTPPLQPSRGPTVVNNAKHKTAKASRNDPFEMQHSLDTLSAEQKDLFGATTLNWMHWLILLVSLIVTLTAWQISSNSVKSKASQLFERQHNQVIDLLKERLSKYEDALWGGVAASHMVDRTLTHQEWQQYTETLSISERYPGISGMGLIVPKNSADVAVFEQQLRQIEPEFTVHPEHDHHDSLIITQIEPLSSNRPALGLDIAFESNRREGAYQARDTGKAVITGPVVLVQDEKKTPGFLFLAPDYHHSEPDTVSERRANFSHWVFAPFIMAELIKGVLEQDSRLIDIQISDNGEVLYSECCGTNESDYASPADAEKTILEIYGRQWLVEAWPKPDFHEQTDSNQPLVILLGGLFIDSIFLLLFLLMTRSNRRLLGLAKSLATASNNLNKQSQELRQSNAELESFAYIASHDLKSPLRGIRDLTEFLEEDLLEASNEQSLGSEIDRNLNRIRLQIDKMTQLVDGVLDYSAVGKRSVENENVDVQELLEEISIDLQLQPHQIQFDEPMPSFFTSRVHLKQVLENLISNAVKYHPEPNSALVTINVKSNDRFFEFSVSDTGIGIDPKFHQRIFEVFQTLKNNPEVESSGIGLAIVKKIVDTYGGHISVQSKLGSGATFVFTWPKSTKHSHTAVEIKQAS